MVFDFTMAGAFNNVNHDLKIFNIRNPKTTTSCGTCDLKVTVIDST